MKNEKYALRSKGINCDFCGKYKPVRNSKYGTSKYNRIICKKCNDQLGLDDEE